jgi:hypothetical protein
MSALPPKADISCCLSDVRYVPITDIAPPGFTVACRVLTNFLTIAVRPDERPSSAAVSGNLAGARTWRHLGVGLCLEDYGAR